MARRLIFALGSAPDFASHKECPQMRSVPRKLVAVAIFAALAGCGPQAQKSSGPVVSGEGFAGVKIGMTVAEAEAALGHKLKALGGEANCSYVEPEGAYDGLAFMVVDGAIARVDVQETAAIVTDAGAKIGDTEAHVLELYKGRTTVQPHKYTGPEGHYVLVLGPDGKAQIVFETDGSKVVSYRAGRQPEVEWVEGCS
jgi:hypothetical protein